MFKTDEIDKLPTICLLGSINQSMTMNSGLGEEKIVYDILDHDMVSITTNAMFSTKYILRRFKQYNRRIGETNNPKYKALVMEFNSMLENNDPKAQSLLKELKKFSSVSYNDFFYVKNEDTNDKENQDCKYNSLQNSYLRICDIHADNMTVEANFQAYTKNNCQKNMCFVIESIYCRKDSYNPVVIYNANSFFCPAFEDVKYNTDHWNKISDGKIYNDSVYQKLYLPIPPKIGEYEEMVDKYSATRTIYTGMWYIITHNCHCQLTMFSGCLNDFIDDYNSFCGLLSGDAHFLCAIILAIINSLLDYLSVYVTESISELISECNNERKMENNQNNVGGFQQCNDQTEEYTENRIIIKHLINIQIDVLNTKNTFKENNSASSNEIMNILQTTLNECCNYANMYRFANLIINYNVKYEYGWVFINLQKLTRIFITSYESNRNNTYKLNIKMGKTFSLTMGLTYIRLNKHIQKFLTKPLLYKNNYRESRYYKRKSKSERHDDFKRNRNEPTVSTSEINNDDFIFEIASAEEEYYSRAMQTNDDIIEDYSDNLIYAPSKILNDLSNDSNPSMTINRIMDLNESALTVVELFPLKPALTSTVASLQGSELDTPHCLFVKKNSDAHNLIVGTSRAKNNIENLKFCFERDVDDITIKPLSNTKIFVQKKILSQIKSGFLEQ